METNIAVFRGKEVRKTIHKNEWWFSIIDVIEVLTGSDRPRKYWSDLKNRLTSEGYIEVSDKIGQLKMAAPDGKMRLTDCANTETMFRIIQSIPSPKAEPFKRWLAKVGYERVQEIEDPELATKRTRALYKAKGYSDDWIEKRLRGIAIREELTDEWKNRDVKQEQEYAILTAEIAKAAFGVTPGEHKELKGLKRENLRDHMTNLERSSRCSARRRPRKSPGLMTRRVLMKAKQPHGKAERLPERREKTWKRKQGSGLSRRKII
jgi:DNA-damage-inducible protein D